MKMNRILVSGLLAATTLTLAAVEPPRNTLGIRASYQPSWVTSRGVSTSVRPGFSAGIVDQIRLSAKVPFYIETGLEFASKGYKLRGYDDSSTTINYLKLPVGIMYHIPVGNDITIQPHVGLYYAYGVWGRLHFGSNDPFDVFGQKSLSRNDFGYNIGAAVTYRNIYLGVSYEAGLIDIAKYDPIYTGQTAMLGYTKLKNISVSITLGYNFNF